MIPGLQFDAPPDVRLAYTAQRRREDRSKMPAAVQSYLHELDRLDARNAARGARGNGKVRG